MSHLYKLLIMLCLGVFASCAGTHRSSTTTACSGGCCPYPRVASSHEDRGRPATGAYCPCWSNGKPACICGGTGCGCWLCGCGVKCAGKKIGNSPVHHAATDL